MSLLSSPALRPAEDPAQTVPLAIGFKDWAVICTALGSGRQSLILRKGGIAEGRDGFRFKHERFFLFPTGYHQQFDKVRDGGDIQRNAPAATDAESVEVRYLFVLEFAHWLDEWSQVSHLEPMHIWREDAVRERFEYGDERGIQCAFGRGYRCSAPWTFPNRSSYGGCRSWVTLPAPPASLSWLPVLDDATHERRRYDLDALLGMSI